MNLRCRSAEATTGSSIKQVMKLPGGNNTKSTPFVSPAVFGSKHILMKCNPK